MPSPREKSEMSTDPIFMEALSKAVIVIPTKGDAVGGTSKIDERMKIDDLDKAEPDSNEGTEGNKIDNTNMIKHQRNINSLPAFCFEKYPIFCNRLIKV